MALRLSWNSLSYRASATEPILPPSTAAVGGGLWLCLGPSGAGKSTLLAVLAGRRRCGAIGGAIHLNGSRAPGAARRALLGYVTQDDVLPVTSTVMEALAFHAALRLPALRGRQRDELVARTLRSLGLARLADRLIGDGHFYIRGLSGGERRRLSVAVELMVLAGGGSGLLLLDEPLSGLDSASAKLLTGALSEVLLASGGGAAGSTLLLTVHQPSHRLLGQAAGVLVLGPTGVLLYCGPSKLPGGGCALSSHFDGDGLCLRSISSNPAEALLEAMADPLPQTQRRLARLAAVAVAAASEKAAEGSSAHHDEGGARHAGGVAWVRRGGRRTAGFGAQLRQLGRRHCTHLGRHPLLLRTQLAATCAVSLGVGVAFWQLGLGLDSGVLARVGLVFFLGLYFLTTALLPLSLYADERLLYFQEEAAGCYGPAAYVLSRTIFDGLLQRLLPSLLCTAIVYPMAGLSSAAPSGAAHVALFAASLTLTNLLGSAAVSLIGIASSSPATSTLAAVLLVLGSLLLSGFLINLPTLAARGVGGLRYASALYYFSELALSDELLGQRVVVHADVDPSRPSTVDIAGEEVLLQLGYELNCTRVLNAPHLACWHDVLAPLAALLAIVATSTVLLAHCVKDPH